MVAPMDQPPGKVLSLVFGRLLACCEVGVLAPQLPVFTLKLGDQPLARNLLCFRGVDSRLQGSSQRVMTPLIPFEPGSKVSDLSLIVTSSADGS